LAFYDLGTVSRCASVFGPLACLDVPSGLGAASTVYGKTLLPSGFVGTDDLPSFNTAKICPSNKPISNANRQKKNKNHF